LELVVEKSAENAMTGQIERRGVISELKLAGLRMDC